MAAGVGGQWPVLNSGTGGAEATFWLRARAGIPGCGRGASIAAALIWRVRSRLVIDFDWKS
jgi:hypothetical protein